MSIPLRVTGLRAAAHGERPGPIRDEQIRLVCDRCGFQCNPLTEEMEFLRRWRGSPDGDLCPSCAGT
jgi:hypothetical protein